jgi:hypothetical protein
MTKLIINRPPALSHTLFYPIRLTSFCYKLTFFSNVRNHNPYLCIPIYFLQYETSKDHFFLSIALHIHQIRKSNFDCLKVKHAQFSPIIIKYFNIYRWPSTFSNDFRPTIFWIPSPKIIQFSNPLPSKNVHISF